MFDGPVRGGTRGGHAEFKWSDVSADKDREVRHFCFSTVACKLTTILALFRTFDQCSDRTMAKE